MPDSPRILFLARSCNIDGMARELAARSETFYCAEARETAPAGTTPFSLREARRLNRALRDGRYDLVISCSNPEPIWRESRSAPSNALRFLRQLKREPGTFGFALLPWMLEGTRVPLAVYDWEDNTIIARKNWALLRRATCYFKTQAPRDPYKAFLFQDRRNDCLFNIVRQPIYTEWAAKLRSISLGVTLPESWRELPAFEKKTDVFFAGAGHYSYVRREGLRQLEELRAEGYAIDLHVTGKGVASIPPDEFLRRSAEAWLVWSPEGAGWDCARHYSTPLTGSVPLLNHPDTRRYEPLIDGRHAFYYGVEGEDLKRVVRLALADKPRLREMAAASAAFTRPRHTHAALAEYLIGETLRTARTGTVPA